MNAWQIVSFPLYKAIALLSGYVLLRHVSIVCWLFSLQVAVRDLKIRESLSVAEWIG